MSAISREYLIGEMIAAEKLGKDKSPEARMSRVLDVFVEETAAIIQTLEKHSIISLLWASSEELTRKGEVPSFNEAMESLEMAQQTEVAKDRAPLLLHSVATMINLMVDEMENIYDQKISRRVKHTRGGGVRVLSESKARKEELKRSRLHAGKDTQ